MNFVTKEYALKLINDIFDKINHEYDNMDSDLIDGVLTTQDEDDRTYVISFHEPTSQIWYSSPVSGAHHFDINVSNEEKCCISTRDHNIKFPDFFFKEISKL